MRPVAPNGNDIVLAEQFAASIHVSRSGYNVARAQKPAHTQVTERRERELLEFVSGVNIVDCGDLTFGTQQALVAQLLVHSEADPARPGISLRFEKL